MRPSPRLTASLAVSAAVIAAATLAFGAGGALLASMAALLGIAARHDNHTGSCLMVATLAVVAVAILIGLLVAMAALHR